MHGWLAFIVGVFTVLGLILLVEASYGIVYYGLSTQFTVAIAVVMLVIAAIGAWLLYAAVRAQYKRVKTGKEALMGAKGAAITELNPKGEVRVNGEFWQAITKGATISSGQVVEVVDLDGMFLVVKAAEEKA